MQVILAKNASVIEKHPDALIIAMQTRSFHRRGKVFFAVSHRVFRFISFLICRQGETFNLSELADVYSQDDESGGPETMNQCLYMLIYRLNGKLQPRKNLIPLDIRIEKVRHNEYRLIDTAEA